MNDTELLKFADDYLANNAAETGSDELIRQLAFALRLASRQEVSVTVEELARVIDMRPGEPATWASELARALLAEYSITKRS